MFVISEELAEHLKAAGWIPPPKLDPIIRTTLYYHASAEDLWDKGIELGLSENACDYFRHAEEVGIEVEIITETGEVNFLKINDKYIKEEE